MEMQSTDWNCFHSRYWTWGDQDCTSNTPNLLWKKCIPARLSHASWLLTLLNWGRKSLTHEPCFEVFGIRKINGLVTSQHGCIFHLYFSLHRRLDRRISWYYFYAYHSDCQYDLIASTCSVNTVHTPIYTYHCCPCKHFSIHEQEAVSPSYPTSQSTCSCALLKAFLRTSYFLYRTSILTFMKGEFLNKQEESQKHMSVLLRKCVLEEIKWQCSPHEIRF